MKITILEIFVLIGFIQWAWMFITNLGDVLNGHFYWNYISVSWLWFYFSVLYTLSKFYNIPLL